MDYQLYPPIMMTYSALYKARDSKSDVYAVQSKC